MSLHFQQNVCYEETAESNIEAIARELEILSHTYSRVSSCPVQCSPGDAHQGHVHCQHLILILIRRRLAAEICILPIDESKEVDEGQHWHQSHVELPPNSSFDHRVDGMCMDSKLTSLYLSYC